VPHAGTTTLDSHLRPKNEVLCQLSALERKLGVGRLSLLCGWDEQPSSERRERRTSILHGSSVDIGAAQDGDIMDFPVHCSQPVGPRALFRLHNHRQGLMAMEKNPLRIFLLDHRENNFFLMETLSPSSINDCFLLNQ
jgi:hypothetical protein